MRFQFYFIFFIILTSFRLTAQIPDGSIAPDFTATDINGVEHNLYDILAEGKSVVIDFGATWCSPCWSYHQDGDLHEYMDLYGPEGTDESMVFMVESDVETTLDDLMGNTPSSLGDWITGTNYPIIDKASIRALYNVYQYPTIMIICPDRKIKNVGQSSAASIFVASQECSGIDVLPEIDFWADQYQGCNILDVQFYDYSWPRPTDFLWDFGDGTNSTEQNPSHSYSAPGNYAVSLQASNNYGENITIKENYISLEEGIPHPTQSVGPESNNIGTGKYFAGGNHGLVFDAHEDFVLASVKVFSEIETERTVVILDENANLIHLKDVMVPTGEYRIELDMFIPQGNNYLITLYSNAFFYRNNSGTNYPYAVDDLVSITSSTIDGNYYYFYDWEVRESGCQSTTNTNDELKKATTTIYPVPVEGYLFIESDVKNQPRLFNSIGQELAVSITPLGNGWKVDFNSLNTGIYFIGINNKIYKVPKL